jgi:hypothetical protein
LKHTLQKQQATTPTLPFAPLKQGNSSNSIYRTPKVAAPDRFARAGSKPELNHSDQQTLIKIFLISLSSPFLIH